MLLLPGVCRTMAEAEAGRAAIRRALRSLKRRHLAEEGAHSPAIEALTRPFAAHVRPISYSPLPTFPNLTVYSFPFLSYFEVCKRMCVTDHIT